MKKLPVDSPLRLLLAPLTGMVSAFLVSFVKTYIVNSLDPSLPIYSMFQNSEPDFTIWSLLLGGILGVSMMKGRTFSTDYRDHDQENEEKCPYAKGRMTTNEYRYLMIGAYILLCIAFAVYTINLIKSWVSFWLV